MQNTMLAAGSGAVGFVVSLAASFGITTASLEYTVPPPPRAIIANGLHWDGKKIGQDLTINSGPVVGDWSASIWRDGKRLCGGGDRSDYETRPAGNIKWMTPDVWTGGTCPPIKPGDTARAVWEWFAEDGSRKSTSISFTISEKKL